MLMKDVIEIRFNTCKSKFSIKALLVIHFQYNIISRSDLLVLNNIRFIFVFYKILHFMNKTRNMYLFMYNFQMLICFTHLRAKNMLIIYNIDIDGQLCLSIDF